MDIAEAFASYYETVYSPVCNRTEKDCEEFLHDFALPTLTQEQTDQLEADLSEEELRKALNSLQSGKAPGPNGLPL